MNKLFKILLVALFAVVGFAVGGTALAGGDENEVERGDISSQTDQSGTSNTGDAVGGQVVGVVSAGDASVDATNRSEDVDITTGDATATNDIEELEVGQENEGGTGDNENEMERGDISSEIAQAASAASGDGVGGSVIGVVTSAGGSADVVAANTSEDVEIDTGDADATNELGGEDDEIFIGQFIDGGDENEMERGDISSEIGQNASASTGDGVGGQVLGIVSAGDASVDATNESTGVDVTTGDALAENDVIELFVGQENEAGGDENEVERGDISSELAQDASANSGDAVAGQVAGVVTSAGGSADLVLANTSEDVDAESGFSEFFNEIDEEFVGQSIE